MGKPQSKPTPEKPDEAAKAAAAAAAAPSGANDGSGATTTDGAAKAAVEQGPIVLKRRGRFVGPAGRAFVSSPFGVTINCRPGDVHDLDEQFKYLWEDKSFATYWDWLEDPREVELVMDPETGRWQLPVEAAKTE